MLEIRLLFVLVSDVSGVNTQSNEVVRSRKVPSMPFTS